MINKRKEWLEYSNLVVGIQSVNDQSSDYNPKISVEQNLMIASISCVSQDEKVLLATEENRELALILSYLYNPKYLMILFNNYDQIECKNVKDYWESFNDMCNEYITTIPYLVEKSLGISRIKNTKFNVIIYSSYEKSISFEVECNERFNMILGEDYESFVDVIKNSRKLLNDKGKLIIFARSCWILPVWELLERNNLQFEYQV